MNNYESGVDLLKDMILNNAPNEELKEVLMFMEKYQNNQVSIPVSFSFETHNMAYEFLIELAASINKYGFALLVEAKDLCNIGHKDRKRSDFIFGWHDLSNASVKKNISSSDWVVYLPRPEYILDEEW